jgi:hypothetical protein
MVISASIVRRDLDASTGRWSEARIVTTTTDEPKGWNQSTERVPLHADGHIPFERVLE